MDADLVIAPEAEQDVDRAYGWYEQQRVGLGEDFLTSLGACLRGICRNPEIHAQVFGNYRRTFLRRFPYAVFYSFNDNTVTAYCVFHTSQDPQKWQRRLSSGQWLSDFGNRLSSRGAARCLCPPICKPREQSADAAENPRP